MATSSLNLTRRIEAGHVEYWRVACGALPGAQLHEDRELVQLITGRTEAPWLNGVLFARFEEGDLGGRVDAAMAPFRKQGLPMLWSVGETSAPDKLGRALRSHGLAPLEPLAAMALELERFELPETPDELTIEPVRDEPGLERWAAAYIDGFEMPDPAGGVIRDIYRRLGFGDDAPFRHFVGSIDGHPVASGTLFLAEGAADVWHISTAPAYRGRGVGAAMTAATMQAARNLGYRYGAIVATAMGAGVYRRLGFEQHGELTQYVWSP